MGLPPHYLLLKSGHYFCVNTFISGSSAYDRNLANFMGNRKHTSTGTILIQPSEFVVFLKMQRQFLAHSVLSFWGISRTRSLLRSQKRTMRTMRFGISRRHSIQSNECVNHPVIAPYSETNYDDQLPSTKIQRLATWQKDVMSSSSDTPVSDADTPDVLMPNSKPKLFLTSTLPKEFDMLKYKEVWSCVDEKLNLNDIFNNEIVHELKRLTGCQIIKDATESKIFVGSNLQEACDQALLKLDTIRKYFVSI